MPWTAWKTIREKPGVGFLHFISEPFGLGLFLNYRQAMDMLKLQTLASFDPKDSSLETFKTERENEDQVHQIAGTWQ
jgi:hypothetical protein